MSSSFDEPPVYDPIISVSDKSGRPFKIKGQNGQDMELVGWLNEAWRPWIISIKEFLDLYITVYGINLPRITQEERDALVNIEDGFCCFVTTNAGVPVRKPEIYINGVWYEFNLTVAP